MRRDAFALLLLGAASVGSYHWITVNRMTPPFHFRLEPSPTRVPGSEVWEATVKPDGMDESVRTSFRLSLASPARSAPGWDSDSGHASPERERAHELPPDTACGDLRAAIFSATVQLWSLDAHPNLSCRLGAA